MEVRHTAEDRVSISLKEYNGLKNDIKLLVQENNKLEKLFESDSKFVIITDEGNWWRAFFSNFEKNLFVGKKTNTVDEFVKSIEDRLKELLLDLKKQKEDAERLKKSSFWVKLKTIFGCKNR